MRLAIMQPYFLPYIGYWQLMACADCFIVYDNIQYTKKGWINRNRHLVNGHDQVFTLPIRHAHEGLTIAEREIASEFEPSKLLARWHGAYRKAPYFRNTIALMEDILEYPETNLFAFVYRSILAIASHLGINTPSMISSRLPAALMSRKGSDKVLAICRLMGASHYVNPIGGRSLYDEETFSKNNIELSFLRSHPIEYKQLDSQHVPWLSIVDVLMFNSTNRIRSEYLPAYDLL